MSRTTSPTYKTGQKLLLLHEGSPVDAIVDEWLGVRKGSRHRVRVGGRMETSSAAGDGGVGGKAAGGAPPGRSKRTSQVSSTIEVDLNEANHTKLLFASVARYEDARLGYCERLISGKHATVRDEIAAKDLRVGEQRVYLAKAPRRQLLKARAIYNDYFA